MARIHPWEGVSYRHGVLGRRVLVVGESNYDRFLSADADYSGIVKANVQDCVFEKRTNAYFTKIGKLLLMATNPAEPSRAEIREVWTRLAFQNYVKTILTGARKSPRAEDWDAAEPLFKEDLAYLSPDVVVVAGKRLGSRLAWLQGFVPYVRTVTIAHPSSGSFSYSSCVGLVADALGT